MNKFSAMSLVVCGILLVNYATKPVHSTPFGAKFGVTTSSHCDDDPNYTVGGDNGTFNFGHKDWIGIIGSGNTVVANTCDELVINGDRNTVTIQGGACKSIYNSGRHNKIIVQGSCQLLRMDWDHNAVIANELGTVQLIGSHNAVTANVINPTLRPIDILKSLGGVAIGRHHPQPQPDPDLQNLMGVVIRGNNNKVTLNGGHCDTIKIAGQVNEVSLSGSCQNLDVTATGQNVVAKVAVLNDLQLEGNLNSITIDKASGGTISGNDDTVIYQHGVGRGHITVAERFKVTGQRDTVKRVTS